MATSQKNPAKSAPDAIPAEPKSKKLLYAIIVLIVLAVAAGGGTWFFMLKDKHPTEKIEAPVTPIFVTLEPLTVNLARGEEGDQFLQVTLTAQVGEKDHEEMFKLYMPQIRSRLLLLLSSKKAADINSEEGKKKLTQDILAAIRHPYSDKGPEQRVMNIFFTSFVIQ